MATGDFLHLESDRAAATKLEQSEYASVTGHGITGGLTGELLVFNGTKLLGALTHGTVLLPATTNLGGSLLAVNAAGPSLLNEAATATNPTLVPNRADPNTGVGWVSADKLSLIAGGVKVVEVASSIVTINPGNANIDVQMRADADSNAFKFDASQYSGQGSFAFGDPGGAPDYVLLRPVVTLPSGQSFHGFRVAHQAITTAGDSGTHALITGGYFGSPAVTKGAGGDTITATASAYFTSVEGDGASNYAIFSDSGLNRFDGDGSNVFELPEDDTDPTSSGGAAVGRIPVKIGGSTHYIAYY